jgi:hypothetical protein
MTARAARVPIVCIAAAASVGLAASQAPAQTCGWHIVPNPQFEGQEFRPTMIVPFSPESAVAVHHVMSGGVQSLAHVRWDGSAWTVTSADPIPDLEDGLGWEVRAVTGSSPDDLWATGIKPVDAGFPFNSSPFLAHWDGTEWTAEIATLFDDPNPQAGDPHRSGEGSGIVVLAPDDIWVMGYGDDLEQTVTNPVVCHWNGSKLEEVGPPAPIYSRSNHFGGADGAGSDSLWIVGYGRNGGDYFHLLTLHWNGSQWEPITSWSPLPGQEIWQDYLNDVVSFGPNDVWAVGKKLVFEDGTTRSASFYLHWDGSAWSEVEGPDIGPLTSVSASGPDAIWASNAFGEFGGRVAHYDGTAWTEVHTADIPGATHIGLARVFASPAGDAWTIGYWAIYDGAGGWDEYHDIIEHYTTDCAAGGGDVDGDGLIGFGDLVAVLAAWGACPGCPEDVDGDGNVGIADLLIVLSEWT